MLVSLAFGFALFYGPRGLTFEAQETIGGTLSIVAVVFVTWMIFWMARAARSLSGELRGQIDDAVEGPWWGLVLVAILAVGREGLETALFLWSATEAVSRDTDSTWQPLVGAALGIATAVVLAYLLYRGAISINLSTFFTWTGGFLILVAGGVLSYGVHDLQEAGVLPGLNNLAWDVSDTIDPTTWYATLLKGIFNFSPATTVLEATVWVLYVVPGDVPLHPRRPPPRTRPVPLPPPSATDPSEGTETPMRKPLLVAALLVTTPFFAACTENAKDGGDTSGDARTVSVTSTDDECKVSAAKVPSGTVTFDVTNDGSQVTEFYLLGEDGLRIVAEVENVGPQLSRQLVVERPRGHLLHRLQAGHEGRRHPRRLHRHQVRRGAHASPPTTSSWSTPR